MKPFLSVNGKKRRRASDTQIRTFGAPLPPKGIRTRRAEYAEAHGIDYIVTDRVIGDVNNDGLINISDVTYIQLYSVRLIGLSTFDIPASDTNGDSLVSLRDATTLQLYLVGYTSSDIGKKAYPGL